MRNLLRDSKVCNPLSIWDRLQAGDGQYLGQTYEDPGFLSESATLNRYSVSRSKAVRMDIKRNDATILTSSGKDWGVNRPCRRNLGHKINDSIGLSSPSYWASLKSLLLPNALLCYYYTLGPIERMIVSCLFMVVHAGIRLTVCRVISRPEVSSGKYLRCSTCERTNESSMTLRDPRILEPRNLRMSWKHRSLDKMVWGGVMDLRCKGRMLSKASAFSR